MVTYAAGKKVSKAPKIQRLVTPQVLQRKRARIAEKKKRIAKKQSEAQRLKEQRERRSESLAKRRSKLSAAAKASTATSA
jgi:small subunit ribosomal protein S6e